MWVAMLFPVNFLRLGFGLKNRFALLILPAVRYRFRIISLLAVAALVSACSAVKIGYNQAPALAYLSLDGYANFTETQSLQVKADLSRLHAWHRQTQLPAYADLLQKMQPLMQTNITPAQVCTVALDIRRKLLAVANQTVPELAVLASTLAPEQLQQLQRKFALGNADYRKDFMDASPAAVRSKRYEQAVSRAEQLYGRLDTQQLKRIALLVDQSGLNPALVYAERLRRQQDTLKTLRTLASSPQAARTDMHALTHALVEQWFESPNAAHRDYLETTTQQACLSIAELHNSTTPAQRQKAIDVLKGYAQDLRALASQNGG